MNDELERRLTVVQGMPGYVVVEKREEAGREAAASDART
jgi:hypothetical protein